MNSTRCSHDDPADWWICDNCIRHGCRRCGAVPIRTSSGFVCRRCHGGLTTCFLCLRPTLEWCTDGPPGLKVCQPCWNSPFMKEDRLIQEATEGSGTLVRWLERLSSRAPNDLTKEVETALGWARTVAAKLRKIYEGTEDEAGVPPGARGDSPEEVL